jgi:uncharacterized protein (TIGR02646 family)
MGDAPDRKQAAQFHWREIDGESVNIKLLPFLKTQTQEHCSFCDAYPVTPPSIDTIEHFRPKSRFPREAYRWTNLYFCCMHCQRKGDDFDEDLLRPDADDYAFEKYFRWDFTTGEMLTNTLALPEDQQRADVTIRLYRLNINHPRFRKEALHIRSRNRDEWTDFMSYRHYV